MKRKWLCFVLAMLTLTIYPVSAFAADGPTAPDLQIGLDTAFTYLAFILVFFMQAGFAMLEAGSVRMKNAGHVAGKTVLTLAIASICFWALGFGLGFGNGNDFFGTTGFGYGGDSMASSFESLAFSDVTLNVKFLFQMAFAAVSLAIVSGGMAERAKLSVYIIFGILFSIFIYPVVAHWVWGGGWLATMGMQDYAGSTVVHLTGATAAVVATILLKPRLGKFNKEGKPVIIPGHNQVFTVLGVIILWFGWFGFNPGSALSPMGGFFGYVALTTNIAAAAGGLAALVASWLYFGKSDIPAMLNGVLAALVAITGACAFVEPWAAFVIGLVAGAFTFMTSQWLERAGLDDPIYAFSVHGIAGMWGAVSTGLFATPELVDTVGIGKAGLFYGGGVHQLGVQVLGVIGTFAFVAILSFIFLYIMKLVSGIRVTEEEELMGLDISEHGTYGYPEQMKLISESESPKK
ncbi:ammonium transporter, Amt family [Paenibacillus sophorae]|uniref:Ammonium transporter n=1 Tax=Paenibacillus sophorae TaxID=1333845 RepID=A0A1H8TXH7_9BACL|nr:ammonium transporter [Paenibacillus sophorae]QWU18068.1 ammonium transporter [Paenibacillus sophorae]SEO95294.1 ammonium transporter, Amt family [Paenibacillus sophorae]